MCHSNVVDATNPEVVKVMQNEVIDLTGKMVSLKTLFNKSIAVIVI